MAVLSTELIEWHKTYERSQDTRLVFTESEFKKETPTGKQQLRKNQTFADSSSLNFNEITSENKSDSQDSQIVNDCQFSKFKIKK